MAVSYTTNRKVQTARKGENKQVRVCLKICFVTQPDEPRQARGRQNTMRRGRKPVSTRQALGGFDSVFPEISQQHKQIPLCTDFLVSFLKGFMLSNVRSAKMF